MTAKNIRSAQLCSTPEVVPFEYREAQEMHSEITIENLVDSEVIYKIKTNKPGLYLVKPMEGKVLKGDKIKIGFKRKELALENYLAIVKNPNLNKQKFLLELNCEVVDAMGITQNLQQSSYLGVKFTPPPPAPLPKPQPNNSNSKPFVPNLTFPQRPSNPNEKIDWQKIITEKERQLTEQIQEKETILQSLSKRSPSKNEFTLNDLINLLIVAFLIGFII